MTTANQQIVKTKKKTGALRMPYGYDRWIHYSMIFLMVFGIIMVASASMGLAVGNSNYLLRTVVKQVIFSIAGYVAMLMISRSFNFEQLRQHMPEAVIIVGGLLLFALVFSAVGGARAWIRIPFPGVDMSIQPSEFAKIMIIMVIAGYFGDIKQQFASTSDFTRRPFGIIAFYILVVGILQSDLGSAVVMALIAFTCFLIPSHPQLRRTQRRLGLLFLALLAFTVVLLTPWGEGLINALPLKEYQKNRILSAINPFADQYNTGYQLINGLVSFATGGWFGLGFGNSVRKYTNFPAANTDFILAIIVEELGIVGFLAVFIPYCIIIIQLFRYAQKIRSEKAKIILVGTAMYFLIHMIFNIGGVTGLIPLTGVPLLMISAGGSSTLSIMCCVGFSQAVIAKYKQGEIE